MDGIANAVIKLADNHFGEYKIRNGQIIPTYCPICHGGESHDKETFAIGMWNGSYNCKRGSCPGTMGNGVGREGSFKQLCNYFGEAAFEFSALPQSIRAAKKTYVKPDPDKFKPLSEEAMTYLASRCISEQTVKDFKLMSDDKGNIVFPFYRDGELVFVKYRKSKKHVKGEGPKEWQDSNTEPILFGMDNTSFNRPLVICEGEIDALSLYEAGVHNVVSVPCGCNNMEWIQLCWEYIEKFNEIILFGDNDEPGMEMVSTLMKRLGEDRCMVPKDYPELVYNGKDYNRQCKDANEILLCYGPEGLKALVDACEPAPIKGVLDVSTINYVDPASVPRIMTKIPALDQLIGGFGEAGITILSGKRAEGKSTITSTFLLQAIQQNYSCCVYSGELSASKFLEWIMLPATESKYVTYVTDKRSGKNICKVPLEIQERIRKWMAGKLYLFDNACAFEEDQQTAVMKAFEMCARRYGCKLFVIDNLMSLLTTADEENKAQARFMAKVKGFANKYKVHVIVIAHPRKEKADSTFSNDTVSGSSVITNLADNVFSIERPNIRVTKNRDFGETGYILCDYDPINRRIYQKNLGDRTVYGWDHTGIKIPEDQACALPQFQIQPGESSKTPF